VTRQREQPKTVYIGRIAVGTIQARGNRFEAIASDGEPLGRFNDAPAAATACWRAYDQQQRREKDAPDG